MTRQLLTLTLLILAFSGAGCGSDAEKAGNSPVAAKPTPEPEISYGQGFYDMERSGSDTWRWMAGEGVIVLKNTGKDMKLRLTGAVPIEQFPQPPTLKVVFNGEQLDQFPGAPNIEKEYVIPAAKQKPGPTSELRIITDNVLVPKDKDPKSNDGRKLGFFLRNLAWNAK